MLFNTTKPEIMAPAGGYEQLSSAVRAGADAVYFGLDDGFNARIRANNLRRDELPAIMHLLRDYGVKAYVTLNTLIFDEELARVEDVLLDLASVGVDALIVQDWGVVLLARSIVPQLPIHGSTQMSITDAAGVRMAQAYGIDRVVVGRELSVKEIAKIKSQTSVEIEAFVHGALCVSYSGQCYSSEAWGGRSANRGQCAQACRMPYDLIVDGEKQLEQDFRYVLSPQDLMGLSHLPQLVEAGVQCLKIEGRLKGPEYVYSTVRAYREALDRIYDKPHSYKDKPFPIPTETRRNLAQVFSRGQSAESDGLTPGFFDGPQHQRLVVGRNPRHRGLFIGEVAFVNDKTITVHLNNPIKRGDGLVFDQNRAEQREPGGNIYSIRQAGREINGEIDQGEVEISLGRQFNLSNLQLGDLIWRTKDAAKDAGLKGDQLVFHRRVPVAIKIGGEIDRPLQLSIVDQHGNEITVLSEQTLQAAQKRPLSTQALKQAVGSLGDTPFEIVSFDVEMDGDLFLPLPVIKVLRRKATSALIKQRRKAPYPPSAGSVQSMASERKAHLHAAGTPTLSLLCRSHAQVIAALEIESLEELVLDFLEVQGLKEACNAVRETDKRLVVAAPRIFKPGEENLWKFYCRLQPDALLLRSAGLLWKFKEFGGSGATLPDGATVIPPLHGDFSLNAANALAAKLYLDIGLERLTLTHDLNSQQMTQLASFLNAEYVSKIEVIAHHHLPIFHTEHCVFARFMSNGNSFKDCGRPCEKHQVHLRDHKGAEHLLLADIGCRNTLFNGVAQSAAPVASQLKASGIQHYRVELVDEDASDVAAVVNGYQQLLAGELDHQALWQQLEKIPNANQQQQGVGLGSLVVRKEMPKSAMKKPTAR